MQGVTKNTTQSRPHRPHSTFSAKTQVIEDRRPILRKMLDAGGCTKGEKFDIHDFARVQSASRSAATAGPSAPVVEIQRQGLRKERWRERVRQTLYPIERRRPLSNATNTYDGDAWREGPREQGASAISK